MAENNLMGRTAAFDPFIDDHGQATRDLRGRLIKGKIDYVNQQHKWFSVKYGNMRTSFKFVDIGKKVKVL